MQGSEPLGVIALTTYDKCDVHNQRAKYALKIFSSSSPNIREYFLFGATATERDEWISAIQEAQKVPPQKTLSDILATYRRVKQVWKG